MGKDEVVDPTTPKDGPEEEAPIVKDCPFPVKSCTSETFRLAHDDATGFLCVSRRLFLLNVSYSWWMSPTTPYITFLDFDETKFGNVNKSIEEETLTFSSIASLLFTIYPFHRGFSFVLPMGQSSCPMSSFPVL